MPPPSISRKMPKNIATTQIMIPPLDLPAIDKRRPNIANGIFNQLSHPSKGINPMIIPTRAIMPNSLPAVCINEKFWFAYSVVCGFSASPAISAVQKLRIPWILTLRDRWSFWKRRSASNQNIPPRTCRSTLTTCGAPSVAAKRRGVEWNVRARDFTYWKRWQ